MNRFSVNAAALIESARVGADSLRTNPMRTTLSTTGVIIGVAALVFGTYPARKAAELAPVEAIARE